MLTNWNDFISVVKETANGIFLNVSFVFVRDKNFIRAFKKILTSFKYANYFSPKFRPFINGIWGEIRE